MRAASLAKADPKTKADAATRADLKAKADTAAAVFSAVGSAEAATEAAKATAAELVRVESATNEERKLAVSHQLEALTELRRDLARAETARDESNSKLA